MRAVPLATLLPLGREFARSAASLGLAKAAVRAVLVCAAPAAAASGRQGPLLRDFGLYRSTTEGPWLVTRAERLRDEIVYGRESDRLRVFVSSKMNGTLDAERQVAADAIEALQGHRAWYWERDAPTGVLHSENECIKYAATSDSIVLLIGNEISPIVLAEYKAASDGGAERFLFVRGNMSRPVLVRDFLEQERDYVVYREFENIAELQSHLYQALTLTLVRNAREQLVRRRARGRSR